MIDLQFAVISSQFAVIDSQFALMNSQFLVVSLQFDVINLQFAVINSRIAVISSWFVVIDSQNLSLLWGDLTSLICNQNYFKLNVDKNYSEWNQNCNGQFSEFTKSFSTTANFKQRKSPRS